MTRLRYLVTQPVADLRHLDPGTAPADCLMEPRHPHGGLRLASRLAADGIDLVFLNQLPWRLPVPARWRASNRFQLANALVQLDRFDGVLAYAEGGVKFLYAAGMLRRRLRAVPILLCHPVPRRDRISQWVQQHLLADVIGRSSAVVAALADVAQTCRKIPRRGDVFYSPTGVDTAFFDPSLVQPGDAPSGLSPGGFVLAAGDSSRDDALLYDALAGSPVPVVRVTRDLQIVPRIESRMNRARGDRLLPRVTFAELRWLYARADVCVYTSRYDAWQAAGSTALTEALACGGICLVQEGGCLQREFTHLARGAGMEAPFRLFSPNDPTELRAGVFAFRSLDAAGRNRLRTAARRLAEAAMPVERSHQAISLALRAGVGPAIPADVRSTAVRAGA